MRGRLLGASQRMPLTSVAIFHSAGKMRGDEFHELDSFSETATFSGVLFHSARKVRGDEFHDIESCFERAAVIGVSFGTYDGGCLTGVVG